MYLANPALPEIVRSGDHVRYIFREPIKVSTPGPDSRVTEVKQFRDRLEFEVWPWASVVLRFQE